MQINDAKQAALTFLGLPDEVSYWQSLGAVSDHLNDAILEVAGPGQYNDQVMIYMLANGSTGNDLNTVILNYWLSLAP